MQQLVRPFVGIAILVGVIAPVVLSSRSVEPPPQGSFPIRQESVDSLFQMKVTSATPVQGVLPVLEQRGTQLDGKLRAAPHQQMVVAANPFEDAWQAPSIGGINLATGGYEVQDVDIALPAAVPWVIGRSYNALQDSAGHLDSNGPQGRNWFQSSQPEIRFYDDANNAKDMVYLFYGAERFAEYKRVEATGPTFRGVNGAAGVFEHAVGNPDTYTLTDQHGNVLVFIGFDADAYGVAGQLWKITDPAGNSAYVGDSESASAAIDHNSYAKGYDSSGRIKRAYDSADRRYTYTYSTLDSVVRLTQVVAETKTGGTWASPSGVATVMTVAYSYYTDESHGDIGDLKQVTVTKPLSDSGVSVAQKKLYRYWEGSSDGTSNYNASTNPGYVHALKYVIDFEGARRYDWLDTSFDDDHLGASDANIEPYATVYFEYDSSRRVREAWFNGECGCSGGNIGTYAFEYETYGSFSDTANTYDEEWKFRTIVQRPDTSYLTQYWDEIKQPLSQVITDADPDNTGPAPSRWATRVVRDAYGSVSTIATPANCTGYTHSTGAITASSSVGLVWEFTRSGSGAMTHFVTARKYREGTSGTLYFDSETEYVQSDLDIITAGNPGAVYVTRPAVDDTTRYPQYATSTSGTYEHPRTVTYDGTDKLSVVSELTTQPAISTGTNGSNSALSSTQYFTVDGRPSYFKTRDNVLSYRAYTNGQVTSSIEDADTSILSDEPGGLSSTGTPFHRVTTYAYDPQGRADVTTYPDGRKTKHYYSKLADGRLVTLTYADFETTPKFHGPVQYEVRNQAGEVEVEALVGLTNNESTTALTGHVDESSSDPIAAMDLGDLVRLTVNLYNESGHTLEESRLFFDIPASGDGADGTNYDPTLYGYDANGRRMRVKEAHGTITRTVHDLLGRVTGRHMGTNDNGWSGGEVSGSDNMVETERLVYDGGADDGNGYLTQRTLFVEDSSTGQRVTTYTNDLRGRVIVQTNPTAPHAFHAYDNEGRVVATGLYSSTGSIVVGSDDPINEDLNRLALSESYYDDVGQLWKSVRYNVDASDGSDDDSLEHLYWRDAEGRVLKEDGPELAKTFYDRIGRRTHRFVLAEDNDSVYADVDDVSGDYVLEEHQTVYASATADEALMTVRIDRTHNDWGGGSTTGPLDTNGDTDALLVTAANLEGRAQIACSWFDRFGRMTDTVQYGDYGGSNFDRDGLSVPSRSDTALVTTYAYGIDGEVLTVTDPRALVARTEHDDAGRTTKEVKNYSAGVNSGNPANPDDNQTVLYTYVDGLRTTIVADMPSGETDQTTTYIYGTVTTGASKVASGHLLRATKYPDTGNGATTSAGIDSVDTDVVSHGYNAQGQEIWRKDQAGNVFAIEYDDAGREIHRRVTTLASGFDNAVLRQSRTYDSLGRPSVVTQYDAATSGTVTDEVAYTYDGWGNVTSFKQDKDSAVGSGTSYEMAYAYAKATTGRNTIRRSQMTLPGNKAVDIDYTKDKDGSCSRVSRLKIGATVLVRYDYLGVGRVVRTQYPQPDISSRVYDPSNDSYAGFLDRFNRPLKSIWATETPSPDVSFYDVDISYDRNSNITWVEDNVHTGFDVKYTMDDLDRLIDAEEGTRSTGSIASRTRHQTWMHSGTSRLSHTGNWSRSKLDLDGDDNWNEANEHDDTRVHNAVNELETRDTDSNASVDDTLVYDAAGNLIDDDDAYEYVYDAFYRLRKVNNQSAVLLAEYRYNGLGHMTGVHEDTSGNGATDSSDKWFYPAYDEAWRRVARYREDDTTPGASDSSPKEQFVSAMAGLDGYGGSSYINDVVCRERDNTSPGWLAPSDGTLEERYYYCPNWRGDISALVHYQRYMAEWVKYSAYGVPFGLPGGDADSDGDNGSADWTQIQTWIDAPAYDVRGDVDLDGDVDGPDKSLVQSAPVGGNVLGWGSLTDDAFKNRAGLGGAMYLAPMRDHLYLRSRTYRADLGNWLQRTLRVDSAIVPPGNVAAFATLTVDPVGSCPGCPFGPQQPDSDDPSPEVPWCQRSQLNACICAVRAWHDDCRYQAQYDYDDCIDLAEWRYDECQQNAGSPAHGGLGKWRKRATICFTDYENEKSDCEAGRNADILSCDQWAEGFMMTCWALYGP